MTAPQGPDPSAVDPVIAPPPQDEQASSGGGGVRTGTPYPTTFHVDYPERLSRWKTGLRIFLILPALIFLNMLTAIGYAAFPAGWVAVFLRSKYPDWLFAAHTGFLGFYARTTAYSTLLTDKYPAFESAGSPVHLEYAKPEPGTLSRWRVFIWKAILIPPHIIVLGFLYIAVFVLVLLAWFAILFTARYPRGMFAFVVGVQRWSWRLHGYFASFHDEYPPFSLSEDSRKAENTTTVIAGVIGGALVAGFTALLIFGLVLTFRPHVVDVDYARLQNGSPSERVVYRGSGNDDDITVRLVQATENPTTFTQLAKSGETVFLFEITVNLREGAPSFIKENDGYLKYELPGGDTKSVKASAVQIDGRIAPRHIEEGDLAEVVLVFVAPDGATPVSLNFKPDFAGFGGIRYDFE